MVAAAAGAAAAAADKECARLASEKFLTDLSSFIRRYDGYN